MSVESDTQPYLTLGKARLYYRKILTSQVIGFLNLQIRAKIANLLAYH